MDILFIIKAIIIAIVEGVTEFIPVSSTGHMIIVADLIKFPSDEFTRMFEVVIQLGAIFAIIVLFWKKLFGLLISFLKFEKKGIMFAKSFIIALIPAIILGFLFEDFIDEKLFTTITVLIGLFVGAIMMLYVEKNFRDKSTTHSIEDVSWKQALKVGLFQCLALWPGMSRSSSTIVGGWIGGLSSEVAAEFSFFLAIPIMFGASLVKLVKFQKDIGLQTLNLTQVMAFILGFIAAFAVALVCVKGFVGYLKKKPMKIFAYYRIGLAFVLTLLLIFKIL